MSLGNAVSVLWQSYTPAIIVAFAAVLMLLHRRLSLQLDPREPLILKPKIPYIGHILGLIRYHSGYYERLHARNPMHIATLPMLNGKLYMITDPAMVQNAFQVAQRMLGVSDATMIPVRFTGDEKNPGFLSEFVRSLHGAMVGQHLHRINTSALNEVAKNLNELEGTFETDSLYTWVRNMMTVVTCEALLGSHNPVKAGSELVQAIWDFEDGFLGIVMNIFPSIFVPKAFKARVKLLGALIKYYSAKHDLEPDVSQLAKVRAALMRRRGISEVNVGKFELALLHVSTSNAIPTLFWQLCYILSNPQLTSIIREELESMITLNVENGPKKIVSIDITRFDSHCPVFVSSYRETIRICGSQVGARRVIEDTMVSDGKNEYLLRAGCDVQLPSGIAHLSNSAWGPDATSFDAKRFLTPEQRGDTSNKAHAEDREQKKAYIPFGGGKHLCPGRNLAFAEILGIVAVLILGFDVRGSEGSLIKVPSLRRSKLSEAVGKPTIEGQLMGAKITRRSTWEDVV